MRAFALSLCLLTSTVLGHVFDKSVLDNVSVSGNVPKPGNVDLVKTLALEKFYIDHPKYIAHNLEDLNAWIPDLGSKEAQ